MPSLPISGLPSGTPSDNNYLAQADIVSLQTQKITYSQINVYIGGHNLDSLTNTSLARTNIGLPSSVLSGINHGDLTIDNVINAPNSTGISLTAGSITDPQKLQLTYADSTNPGVMSASGNQIIGGNKQFVGTCTASNLSGTNHGDFTTGDVISFAPNSTGMFITAGGTLTPQNLQLCAADATNPGVMTATGSQIIGGNKQFVGTCTASNLSGTNYGDFTTSNVSTSSPNSTGMFLTFGNSSTPQNLQLCAADGSNPGVITAADQTFGGNKTFTGNIILNNSNKIGLGTSTPDVSALLDINSTTKGFLPSRMTTTQRTSISSPAGGLIVYDTTLNQWFGYNGTSWSILG